MKIFESLWFHICLNYFVLKSYFTRKHEAADFIVRYNHQQHMKKFAS